MHRAVERGLSLRELGEIEHVSLDEKSFQRGHAYGTVLCDVLEKRVLDVAPGRAETGVPVFARCPTCGRRWQICGAINRSGGRCGRAPMPNGRCHLHGGKSTGPPLVHGRRSKYLPQRLMGRAMEALKDPDMVALLEDIAIIEALMIDRLEQLGEDSQAQLWGKAIDAFNMAEKEGLQPSPAAAEWLNALRCILQNGQGRARAEREIMGLQEHKRKMTETEIKRQHVLNQYVGVKELNVLAAGIVAIINECVKDESVRRAIAAKLVNLFSR